MMVLGILQRVVKWWRCRCPGEWVRAAKLNLQQALNTRIPNAVLNFAFKLRYRQVSAPSWWSSTLLEDHKLCALVLVQIKHKGVMILTGCPI